MSIFCKKGSDELHHLEDENRRLERRVRLLAPCCRRYKYSYEFEQDIDGTYYCRDCWLHASTPIVGQENSQKQQGEPSWDLGQGWYGPAAANGNEAVPVWPDYSSVTAEDAHATEHQESKEEHEDVAAPPPPPHNPNEPPMQPTPPAPPWREVAALSPKRRRVLGKMETWLLERNYGFADFQGFNEKVFVHVRDVDHIPAAGDKVEGIVHRRRNGKLQAYKVSVQDAEEKLHETLLGL